MFPSELADRLQQRLLDFCWGQWSQMGVLAAAPPEPSRLPQDPEALIVLTLEVARSDARLFDEVLDWMALNERLLSLRRLRAMSIDDEDRALVLAASTWLAWQRRSGRGAPEAAADTTALVDLFPLGGPPDELDPSFAAAGFARPRLTRSGKSVEPDLALPINLALRLRAILGVGIRAEVIRIMLGTHANWMTAQVLARSSTYSRRNVHDALGGLCAAGIVSAARISDELRYTIEPDGWAALLGYAPGDLPAHREWRSLFAVLRRVLRWSRTTGREELSEYMLASETRQLIDTLRGDLTYAGVPSSSPRTADQAPAALREIVERALVAIGA